MASKKSPKFASMALTIQENAIDLIDLKRELEPFTFQIAEAVEDAKKGKLKKLKKLAATMEIIRVIKMFAAAMDKGDVMMMEYYGKIIRENIMDKPKVSMEYATDGKAVGVVILPAVVEENNE